MKPNICLASIGAVLVLLCGLAVADGVKPASSWPGWRGPYRNGITATTQKWSVNWPEAGPKKIWTTRIGDGYSCAVVVGNRVLFGGWGVVNGKKNCDSLYCLNADTGEILWQRGLLGKTSGWQTASTPIVDGNVVYMISDMCGVGAYEVETGKEVWTHDMGQEGVTPLPSRCWAATPIVEGNLLIINGGATGMALDKTTGKVVWKSDPDVSAYVSPVAIDVDGQHLILMVTGTNIVAVKPADGSTVFSAARKSIKATEHELFADPIVVGNDIEFSGIWMTLKDGNVVHGNKTRNYTPGTACQPILLDGCIYGPNAYNGPTGKVSDYGYRCRDWASGEIKWEQKGIVGQQILVDDKLVMLSIDGKLIVLKASSDKYEELARAQIFSGYKEGVKDTHCLTAPTFVDGKLYLRKGDSAMCLDLRE